MSLSIDICFQDCVDKEKPMWKKYAIFILLLLLVSCRTRSEKYSLDELNWWTLRQFIGEDVNSFLEKIDENYEDYTFSDEPPGYLNGCFISYREYYIYIELKYPLEFLEYHSPGREWDFDDFKREQIKKIIIDKIE